MVAELVTLRERTLASVSTAELWAELVRRGEQPTLFHDDIERPGLLVQPSAALVTWQGQNYALSPRLMGVFASLARAHPRGRTRAQLATDVWGVVDDSTIANAGQYIWYLRRIFPTMIWPQAGGQIMGGSRRVYRLCLTPEDNAIIPRPWQSQAVQG